MKLIEVYILAAFLNILCWNIGSDVNFLEILKLDQSLDNIHLKDHFGAFCYPKICSQYALGTLPLFNRSNLHHFYLTY